MFCVYLFLISIFLYFFSKIKFEEDITKVIPTNNNSTTLVKALKQLRFSDKITVIFKAKNKKLLVEKAQNFLDSLQLQRNIYKNIHGVINEEQLFDTYKFIYNHLPIYLEEQDYQTILNKVKRDSVNDRMFANYKQLVSPSGIVTKDFILKDPLGITSLGLKKLEFLKNNQSLIFEDGFLFTPNYENLILFISPIFSGTDTKKNKPLIDFLKNYKIESLSKNETLEYFGSTIIADENEIQIKRDIFSTVVIALILLFLLLIYYFKKIYLPIIAFIPTIYGVTTSLAIISLIKPSISAISLSIGAILLGVTIDFSLHILNHLKSTESIEKIYTILTKPIFNASLTTAISFVCLTFVNSEVLSDLGLFAALTVLSSAFYSLVILPHIYKKDTSSEDNFLSNFGQFSFEKNKLLIFILIIGVVLSFFVVNKVKFDNDISKLNFMSNNLR